MHEWALAEAIVEYVKKALREANGEYVERLSIVLGKLQSIDREVLGFALREILRMENICVKELVFRDEDVELLCRRCGYRWVLDLDSFDEWVREAIHFVPEVVHSYIKCPQCGSHDFEVVRGRGVGIGEIIVK